MNPMKPHLEFHPLDMSSGWERPEGYPVGIEQKVLAGTLDEANRTGSRTSRAILRFGRTCLSTIHMANTMGG